MRVIAIQTSPSVDGLTSRLAQSALAGAKSGGAETELVHLNNFNIQVCHACDTGWGKCRTEGKCQQNDDFEIIRQKINTTDGVIISTPVYFGDLSESLKVFLDRLRRCDIADRNGSPLKGTRAIGIAAAGGSGGGAVNCLRNLESYMNWFQFVIFDLMPVTRRSASYKLKALEEAGKNLVMGS